MFTYAQLAAVHILMYVHLSKFCRHHKKILDLSSLFRYANLPQNAKLEMVPTGTPRTESKH